MSAKSSLAIFGVDRVMTFEGSTTVRATSAMTFECSSLLTRTLKISRISTAISTWKALATPAQIVRMRSRISARTSSSKARTVPQSFASAGMML